MNSHLDLTGEYSHRVSIDELNTRVKTDALGFVEECESAYNAEVNSASDIIASRIKESRIVMLAGPSGSGKTTTAKRIKESLLRHGIRAHTVEMDSYFIDVDKSDLTINYELPERLDLPLLLEHMEKLSLGNEVLLPSFDFLTGRQIRNVTPMQLGSDEVAIFEGIHALNDIFRTSKADLTDIYISVRMRITDSANDVIVKPEEMRFLRRGVRDVKFRGASFDRTLDLWENVLDGEINYIRPFKKHADIIIDTSLEYEVNLLASYASEQFLTTSKDKLAYSGMAQLPSILKHFEPISSEIVPKSSMLREFIG